MPRQGVVQADKCHQARATGRHERHPQLEGVESPGELHTIVGKADLPERFAQIVGWGNGKGRHELLPLPHQGAAALIGNRQPLVRIEGQGVGAFHAAIPGSDSRVESAKGPIRTVYMKPELFLLAEVCDGREWIDGSRVGGSSIGYHTKRLQPVLAIMLYGSV